MNVKHSGDFVFVLHNTVVIQGELVSDVPQVLDSWRDQKS